MVVTEEGRTGDKREKSNAASRVNSATFEMLARYIDCTMAQYSSLKCCSAFTKRRAQSIPLLGFYSPSLKAGLADL